MINGHQAQHFYHLLPALTLVSLEFQQCAGSWLITSPRSPECLWVCRGWGNGCISHLLSIYYIPFSTSSAAINQCYLLLSTPWAASQGERQALLTITLCVLSNAKTELRIQTKPVLFLQLLRGRILSKSCQLHHPWRPFVAQAAVTSPSLKLPAQAEEDNVSVEQCFWFCSGKENLKFLVLMTISCQQAPPGLGCWMNVSYMCAEMCAHSLHFCHLLMASKALEICCGWSKIQPDYCLCYQEQKHTHWYLEKL